MNENKYIIKIKNVYKNFINNENKKLIVLDNINFNIKEGEIIAILGKSGSGKSTLLRLISGLINPSSGFIYYRNKLVTEPISGINMVFQNFALLPWLSVLENVELGLIAKGIPENIRRQKTLKAIDIIGLDGFESAYPKEISGGMKQRVGFARALVVEPELLLMDEPFSALDILTAENLRNDLMDLWIKNRTNIKSILCVTHDIEEAILMANKIIILSSNPGRIQTIINVNLEYPRNQKSYYFKHLLDHIYTKMIENDYNRNSYQSKKIISKTNDLKEKYILPDVDVSELTGLLEAMDSYNTKKHINLPDLSESLHLDVNNLFPLTKAADMLHFTKINEAEIKFTKFGKEFIDADILQRKQLFAKHLMIYIPLAIYIKEKLDKTNKNKIHEIIILNELKKYLNNEESEKTLKTIIDWGRYAEIFAYDYNSKEFSLENPQ